MPSAGLPSSSVILEKTSKTAALSIPQFFHRHLDSTVLSVTRNFKHVHSMYTSHLISASRRSVKARRRTPSDLQVIDKRINASWASGLRVKYEYWQVVFLKLSFKKNPYKRCDTSERLVGCCSHGLQ